MTILEQIQKQVSLLPPDQQDKVLSFVLFLRQEAQVKQQTDKKPSLKDHPAFGSWRARGIDALEYEQSLRNEWDSRP